MASRDPSYNWRRREEFPEQRYPLALRYSMQPFDTNTSYTGYQPTPVSDGSTHYTTNSARYYPDSQPPPPKPPKPSSPYFRRESYSSFTTRGQPRDYAFIPENDYQPRSTPLRGRVTRIPLSDVDHGVVENNGSFDANVSQPASIYNVSVPDTINETSGTMAEEPDKSNLVLTSVHNVDTSPRPSTSPYIHKADVWLNRILNAMRIKHAFRWAHPQCFHENAWFSCWPCHSYQPPRHYFESFGAYAAKHKHLDVFHRAYEGLEDDQYLDPLNGRVRRLCVQTIRQIYDTDNDTSWRRTYVEDVSPWILRLAWWSRAGFVTGKKDYTTKQGTAWKDVQSRTASLNADQWTQLGLRWIPSCIGLLVLMCFPTDIEGQVRNHGFYDPVPYRFWSYPKSARNYYENKDVQSNAKFGHADDLRLSKRSLSPRYLCFLDFQSEQNPRGRFKPQEWIDQTDSKAHPMYIFISYTGEKQFERLCPTGNQELKEFGSSSCSCDQCNCSKSDADALHEIARIAAKNARVPAYWTDQCCMSTNPDEFSEDIYGICDVVRGAQRIVVVVGRSGQNRLPANISTQMLLNEWGTRMWTWPEVLLAPVGKRITVYTRGGSPELQPVEISKLSFAKQVWDDAPIARYLVDHFENTLKLSQLELVVLALECLTDRVIHGTTPFADGDLSYALMGLLRQRPKTDKVDTAFQAFARLSLANDSDRLLERLICLLPIGRDDGGNARPGRSHDPSLPDENADKEAERAGVTTRQRKLHYWTNMDDHWGAKLWDVEPHCQVAGIAAWDTVILDGAYGATVHWDSFQRVAITTRETWSRMLARFAVRGTPAWFFTSLLIIGTAGGNSTSLAFGAIILTAALVLILLSPILLLHIYSGKVWNSQPWLFGFEGHMSLEGIEKKIFGFPCDRLSWAPYSSAMSRHQVNDHFLQDECQGRDPFEAGYQPPRAGSSNPTSLRSDGTRLFTVVDTMTMTVSTFYAKRPPVVALLCGSEGGMQRAVMCSYDWTTQTLYRETVLRMETRMLERMPRIGRVRFGLKRGEGKP